MPVGPGIRGRQASLQKKETIMKWQWIWIRRKGVLLVLLGASLCWSAASINMSAREGPSPAVNVHMVDLSLAQREPSDFLLTPALLVQEAVSDGVILTYPEE